MRRLDRRIYPLRRPDEVRAPSGVGPRDKPAGDAGEVKVAFP
jgi:hypothetical protein